MRLTIQSFQKGFTSIGLLENLSDLSVGITLDRNQKLPKLSTHIRVLRLFCWDSFIDYPLLLEWIQDLNELERLELTVSDRWEENSKTMLQELGKKRGFQVVLLEENAMGYYDDGDPEEWGCGCDYCLGLDGAIRLEDVYVARKGLAVRDYA